MDLNNLDLKKTLNLPDPDFTIPMRADLPKKEPVLHNIWNKKKIYQYILSQRKDAPTFTLHDGPPYTNAPIHLGTAMNKIIKDFVVKSKTLMGYRCEFVPGFDNHGLPIELTVAKKLQNKKIKYDTNQLLDECRNHAKTYIDTQSEQFQRLGVFGEWDNPYFTMDYQYEAGLLKIFKKLVEKGYIYRGLRPVMWSPTSRTALADTEIIYQEHTSSAIHVSFRLLKDTNHLFNEFPEMSAVVWTTTPWTLPANVAIAFHPNHTYSIIKANGRHFLLVENLVQTVAQKLEWNEYQEVGRVQGKSLEGTVFEHPYEKERESVSVLADYVTTEDGTGIVHTAPGHGREDFIVGLKYNLPVLCPVDHSGKMTQEAGPFKGLSYVDCNQAVVKELEESGNLLLHEKHIHKYPYAERDKKPIIFRATEQWFINIDANGLRKRILDEISNVEWIPESGKTRITAMITNRPDWCISRQRPWGVGIPVLYGKDSGKPVLDPVLIDYITDLVSKHGSQVWHTSEAMDLVPDNYVHPSTGETEFTKETDVFDVWFDSGCTNLLVLNGLEESRWNIPWPADLIMEGSDQHRGWFNTSLIVSMAVKETAPFKGVLTHGMIVDSQGNKMSKSLGNVVDPLDVCSKFGAEILRYWAASVDTKNDVPCTPELLSQCGDGYRRIRNTLRYLLSNLYDYDGSKPETLHELDIWLIEQIDLLVHECVQQYNEYNFVPVINLIHNFCSQEISAFYADAVKDRMYCDGANWDSRRSCQYASHYALIRMVKLISPVLMHTAEEVYHKIPHLRQLETVHAEILEVPTSERLESISGNHIQTRFAGMLNIRSAVFGAFEEWKKSNDIKDSQDVVATISETAGNIDLLKSFESDLAIYFKMSDVKLKDGKRITYKFAESDYLKCDRSRIRRKDVKDCGPFKLSARDREVLGV